MDIDQAKAEIARRATNAGFVFEPSEIITGPLEGQILVALRSVRAMRTIEQEDGSFTLEEFNSPIIWIDMPSPLLNRAEIDHERQVIHYTFFKPNVRVLHPEFCILIPDPASPSAPAVSPD